MIRDLRRGLPGKRERGGLGVGVLEEWAFCAGAPGGGLGPSAGDGGDGVGGVSPGSGRGRETRPGLLPWAAAMWRLWRDKEDDAGLGVWVGKGERPYLPGDRAGSASWLMVSAGKPDERVWAIERCVRCVAVSAVVADGRGMSFTATRRLQLAAESGGGAGATGAPGARVILLRDEGELARPSAARVRGVVWPEPSGDGMMRWNAQLLRRKGVRPTDDLAEGDRVVLEMRHGQVVVMRGAAEVADRPGGAGSVAGGRVAGAGAARRVVGA